MNNNEFIATVGMLAHYSNMPDDQMSHLWSLLAKVGHIDQAPHCAILPDLSKKAGRQRLAALLGVLPVAVDKALSHPDIFAPDIVTDHDEQAFVRKGLTPQDAMLLAPHAEPLLMIHSLITGTDVFDLGKPLKAIDQDAVLQAKCQALLDQNQENGSLYFPGKPRRKIDDLLDELCYRLSDNRMGILPPDMTVLTARGRFAFAEELSNNLAQNPFKPERVYFSHKAVGWAIRFLRGFQIETKPAKNQAPDEKLSPFVHAHSCTCKRIAPKNKNQEETYQPLFSFVPVNVTAINADDGEYLQCDLVAQNKAKKQVTFGPEIWSSLQRFLLSLPSSAFTTTAKGAEIQQFRQHLNSRIKQTIKGVNFVGIHEIDGQHVFADHGGCFTAIGPAYNVALVGQGREVQTAISKKKPCVRGFGKLFDFNEKSVTLSTIGWAVATFYKKQIFGSYKKFPLLLITGERGSGKTTSLRLLGRLWATDRIETLSTEFSALKAGAGSNVVPIFFDENKSTKQSEEKQKWVSNLIRESYDGHIATRGQMQESNREYVRRRPIAVSGETGFSEPALLDRFCFAFLSESQSQKHFDIFKKIEKSNLEGLGRAILNDALITSEAGVRAKIEEQLKKVDPRLRNRPAFNAAVARFGCLVVAKLCKITITDQDLKAIDQAVLAGLSDGNEESIRLTAVDQTMAAMAQMAAEVRSGHHIMRERELFRGSHFETDGEKLWLHVASAHAAFRRWSVSYQFEGEKLSESDFTRQLKGADYYSGTDRIFLGGNRVRVAVLDLEKLSQKVEIFGNWRKCTTDAGSGEHVV